MRDRPTDLCLPALKYIPGRRLIDPHRATWTVMASRLTEL